MKVLVWAWRMLQLLPLGSDLLNCACTDHVYIYIHVCSVCIYIHVPVCTWWLRVMSTSMYVYNRVTPSLLCICAAYMYIVHIDKPNRKTSYRVYECVESDGY